MIDQHTEALMFQIEHQEEIAAARSAILDAVQRFLSSPDLAALIPGNILEKVQQCIHDDEPENIAFLVRDLASEFVKANLSAPFWALIDGCFFLKDATGCRWPYMTQDRRSSALHCAVVEANSVNSSIH